MTLLNIYLNLKLDCVFLSLLLRVGAGAVQGNYASYRSKDSLLLFSLNNL